MENEGKVTPNEKTAVAQIVTNQPDGPGKRIGKRGELTMIGNVLPGGAELFRQRLPQFQAEAGYYEGNVGTVQDFRIFLFDNDTRFVLSLVYDGDFKPYLRDIATYAGEWLDGMATGILEGYTSMQDPNIGQWVVSLMHPAEFFYVGTPNSSVRDVRKMEKISRAVSDLLDAAN
jgi:hypothetical protein